jgi:hypothetical protein
VKKISLFSELAALGAVALMERPLEISNVIVAGEVAAKLELAEGTVQTLFVVKADTWTSSKGNEYVKGTYWFSKPLAK